MHEKQIRIISSGLTAAGISLALLYWIELTRSGGNPVDFRTYFGIDPSDPYGGWVLGGPRSFQYSPAFVQLMSLVQLVPFDIALAAWRALALICVVWLAGPLTIPALLWGPVGAEISAGNINIFLAAAIAAGFRYPGTWSLVLLTKITPAVGLGWFAVRREWRHLIRVGAVTGAIALASAAAAPDLWVEWVGLIANNAGSAVGTFPFYVPLALRLPLALIVVLLGARLGWKATVGIAATVGAPILYYPTLSLVLASLPPIRDAARRRIVSRAKVAAVDALEAVPTADEA